MAGPSNSMTRPWTAVPAWIVVLALDWYAGPAFARAGQDDSSLWAVRPAVGESGELAAATRVDQATSPAGREFVIAPMPIINPTLDNGVALVAGMLYPLSSRDTVSPPSATFLAGFTTSNDSWALGGVQTLRMSGDRYRALVAAGYADINIDFYGIGTDAGSAGDSVLLNETGAAGIAQFLVRAAGAWYVGTRYRLMRMRVRSDAPDTFASVPPADTDLRTGLLGPVVVRDTRDDQFYPRNGSQFDAIALFAGSGVGGRRTYQTYQVAVSMYRSLGRTQVLASRMSGCYVAEEAPFYDLCLIGQYQDLRGYPAGQYRDQLLFSGQSEYRVEVWKRFGLVVFGGLGEVADRIGALSSDAIRPSAGAGVRFRLTRSNHVNLRADYAWGIRSNALYLSVGEAF